MVKSSKPGKQRKAQANAPQHIKRRNVAARLMLANPDERLAHLRSTTVRVGDTVRVIRGDMAHGGIGPREGILRTPINEAPVEGMGRLLLRHCYLRLRHCCFCLCG